MGLRLQVFKTVACALALVWATGCASATKPQNPVAEPTEEHVEQTPHVDEPTGAPFEAPSEESELPKSTIDGVQLAAAPASTSGNWVPIEPTVPHDKTHAIVLMYHSIDSSAAMRAVSPENFERHMVWMRQNHVEIVPLSKFVDYNHHRIELPEKVAVVTVDDGERSFYYNAYPSVLKHQVHFALGLPTVAIEQSKERKTLTWDMVREMVNSGYCEIASHSHTHPDLAKLSPKGIKRELELSRYLIQKHTGITATSFFYPMGSFNRSVLDLTEQVGYDAGFIAVGSKIKPTTDLYRIPRFDMRADTGPAVLQAFFVKAGIWVDLMKVPQKNKK